MRYLLDQEEMDALVPREALEAREAALAQAKDALLKATGFTCVHQRPSTPRPYGNYCDFCPAFSIEHLCRLPKAVSK